MKHSMGKISYCRGISAPTNSAHTPGEAFRAAPTAPSNAPAAGWPIDISNAFGKKAPMPNAFPSNGIAPLPGARFGFGHGVAKDSCFGAVLSQPAFNSEAPASTGGFKYTKAKAPSMPPIVTAPTANALTPGDVFRAAFEGRTIASTPGAFPFGIAPHPGARFDFGGVNSLYSATSASAGTPNALLPAARGKVNPPVTGHGSKKRGRSDNGGSPYSKRSRPGV